MASVPPPPPEKKSACMFVIDEDTRKMEWHAFEVSDDPKHNQPLPPLYMRFSHDCFSHLLPFHDDEEPGLATTLDPIATAPPQEDVGATGYVIFFPEVGHSLYRICTSVDGMKLGDDSSVEPIIDLIGCGGKEESSVEEEEEAQASGAFMAYDPKLNEWESLPDPLRIKKDFFLGGHHGILDHINVITFRLEGREFSHTSKV
ncbi:hypothetical protein RHGRI_022008 [Rhododendron griersonianum]|uniref:Uncharacterized protein n=1 Tax=Rhododendron griersonianum TaxID=479676 RepID=A0AAV6JMG0_9ERIC|nr:hypothetical protein RHGRI_022008 [Rhododendron griersonianum]